VAIHDTGSNLPFRSSPRIVPDGGAPTPSRGIGRVTLSSPSPSIQVSGVLTEPVDSPLPRPKYDTLDRYGFFGLSKYAGHDPYELTLKIRLEDGGDSLEGEGGPIRRLERLAERVAGRDTPPDVTVDGPVPHSTLTWRITGLVEDKARTVYSASGDRTRFVVSVTLAQRVTDTVLSDSLRAMSQSKGVGATTRVRQGEDSLYDVAQRYYHDSSLATTIARANPVNGNPMPLGTRLHVNQRLVMP
jgi:hypothetical protein